MTFNQSSSTIVGEYSFGNVLIIDSGAVLTITDTIHCTDNARIVVLPGGKLVVDGGTLTSACDGEMWQGIEVVGNRNNRQLARHQGTVELRNGAVIENAHCAIYTGIHGDTSFATAGGIIYADSAYFHNNRKSVGFVSYTNHTYNGYITDNVSHFNKCTFIVDNGNHFSQENGFFLNHISMWQVNGVKIRGCSFENAISGSNDRRQAIYTEEAGFTVNRLCGELGLDINNCTCIDTTIYCTFSGFNTAIEANTTGYQYPVNVEFARFSNNNTGLYIHGNNFVTVTRNQFDLTNPTSHYVKGLVLDNCTNYKVEGNSFEGVVNYVDGITKGILVINSGSTENRIYLDTLNSLTYAVSSIGDNSGLQVTCNTFDHNGTDIYVDSESTIALSQGNALLSAGNKFGLSYGFNIENSGSSSIEYYYSGLPLASNTYYPFYSINVSPNNAINANNCLPTLCGNIVPTPITSFSNMMNQYTSAANGVGNADGTNMNGGNETPAEMQQSLSETYYETVRALMSDTVLDLDALEQWHTAAQPIADPYSLTETRFMKGYSEPFVTDADNAELANYAEFHAMKLALRNNDDAVGANNYSPLQGGTTTVNMRKIPAGVYVLRVTDAEGKTYNRKVVRK